MYCTDHENHRANHVKEGQAYKFFSADRFPNSQLCFRLKPANAFQRRTYDADYCLNLHVGEGEKVNYKKPPKLTQYVANVVKWPCYHPSCSAVVSSQETIFRRALS
jgi:hypothetical protein